jgi:hypothetical protein
VAGLLCGVLIGLAIGSADPDPSEAATRIRSSLVAAAGSLEVAAIEYEEAVTDGRIEAQAEYDGALDALGSSNARYREVRGALEALVPDVAEDLDGLYERCRGLMEDTVDTPEVVACLEDLEAALQGDA